MATKTSPAQRRQRALAWSLYLTTGMEANLRHLQSTFELNDRDVAELTRAIPALMRTQDYLRRQLGTIPKGQPE